MNERDRILEFALHEGRVPKPTELKPKDPKGYTQIDKAYVWDYVMAGVDVLFVIFEGDNSGVDYVHSYHSEDTNKSYGLRIPELRKLIESDKCIAFVKNEDSNREVNENE